MSAIVYHCMPSSLYAIHSACHKVDSLVDGVQGAMHVVLHLFDYSQKFDLLYISVKCDIMNVFDMFLFLMDIHQSLP